MQDPLDQSGPGYRGNNGKYQPQYPNEGNRERALTHEEMNYNLDMIGQVIKGYRVIGLETDPKGDIDPYKLIAKDPLTGLPAEDGEELAKVLKLIKVTNDRSDFDALIAAGASEHDFVWIPVKDARLEILDNADNRVLTATGKKANIQAEANLTFDGDLLNVGAEDSNPELGNVNIDGWLNVGGGIEDATPTYKFQINHTDDVQEFSNGAIEVRAVSNYGVSRPILSHRQDTNQLVVNEDGVDLDFRIEGDNDQNLFRTDASLDRVGIGTNNPGYKLDINGGGGIRIKDASNPLIYFSRTDEVNGGIGMTDDTKMRFAVGTVGLGSNTKMVIDDSGNVGIGTTQPDAKLHVATSGEVKLDLEDTGGQQYRFFVRNSDKVFGIYDVSSPKTWFRYKGHDTASNTNLALLEGGGKVGIGTDSPTSNLHVASTEGAEIIIEADSGDDSTNEANNAKLTLKQDGGKLRSTFGLSGKPNGDFVGALRNSTYINSTTTPIQLVPGGTLSTTFLNNGNVGIGTNSPNYKLDVNGTARFTDQVTIPETPTVNTHAASKGYVDSEITSIEVALDAEISATDSEVVRLDGKINTEKGRIDAILLASDADKDSFAEIVTFINAVDLENDNALAAVITNLNNEISDTNSDMVRIGLEQAAQDDALAAEIADTNSNFVRVEAIFDDYLPLAGGTMDQGSTIVFDTEGTIDGGDLLNIKSSDTYITLDGSNSQMEFYTGGSQTMQIQRNTGNVGIGETNPSQKLHVTGNILASGRLNANQVRVDSTLSSPGLVLNSTVDGSHIKFNNGGAESNAYVQTINGHVGIGRVLGHSTNNLNVRQSDGFVGIKQKAPLAPLHIKNNGEAIRLESSGNNQCSIDFTQGTNKRGHIEFSNAEDTLEIKTTNPSGSQSKIKFSVALEGQEATEAMRIQHSSDGGKQVVIGNQTGVGSDSELYVAGDIEASGKGKFSGQVTIPETPTVNTHAASKGYVDILDGKINTEKGRIDAILLASDADKDSFAEIVTFINSVDLENDDALATVITNLNDEIADTNSDVSRIDAALADEISSTNSDFVRVEARFDDYLPLAGGTLTGTLSGTSANFTGTVRTSGRLNANQVRVDSTLSSPGLVLNSTVDGSHIKFNNGGAESNAYVQTINGHVGIGRVLGHSTNNLNVRQSDGFVGIKQKAPLAPLHIKNNGEAIRLESSGNNQCSIDFTQGTNKRGHIEFSNAEDTLEIKTTNPSGSQSKIKFSVALQGQEATEAMRIQHSSNGGKQVVIGNQTGVGSDSELYVSGDIEASGKGKFVDLTVSSTVDLNGALLDGNNSTGDAGQILSSTGTGQVEWVDQGAAITTLIPHFQTATPGGSDTYTQSNNIVDFDWSGGSGTYEYILPSATAIPYRTIRFVNNSTITAQDKIHITAPGTETIDGSAFYEINKPYNGCAVWSDGVQWIVIQAKG